MVVPFSSVYMEHVLTDMLEMTFIVCVKSNQINKGSNRSKSSEKY